MGTGKHRVRSLLATQSLYAKPICEWSARATAICENKQIHYYCEVLFNYSALLTER